MGIQTHRIGIWVSSKSQGTDMSADKPACLNTAIGIAVFLEDSDAYNNAMSLFQEAVPSVIYLESDGNLPKPPRNQTLDEDATKSRWFNQQSWGNANQSGQIQVSLKVHYHHSPMLILGLGNLPRSYSHGIQY
jgi:hypothetical protein